jgi:hypothetical protein
VWSDAQIEDGGDVRRADGLGMKMPRRQRRRGGRGRGVGVLLTLS